VRDADRKQGEFTPPAEWAAALMGDAMVWLKTKWAAFRDWLRRNKEVHMKAPPHACCSAPPPEAGKHADKGD